MRQGFLSRLWDGADATALAQMARLALEAGRMGAWSYDVVAGTVRGTGELAEFFDLGELGAQGRPVETFFQAIHADDVDRVRAAVAALTERNPRLDLRYRIAVPGRPQRWVALAAQVTEAGADGSARTVSGVIWDETASMRREAELRRLTVEMDHQVKNAFATIRALVNLGARAETDIDGFAETMRASVQALADIHELMSRSAEAGEAGVTLPKVLERALAAWDLGEVELLGDAREVVLGPRRASAMAMIVYHLAATAARRAQGAPEVRIATAFRGETAVLVWTERLADPPGVHPAGFDTLLLQQCASTLRGVLRRERVANGLRVQLEMPADG